MKLKNIPLLYNAAAHFAGMEKFPDGLIEELRKEGAATFDALCWALAEMAKQAELMRRHMGETPKETPSEEDFRVSLRPNQIRPAMEKVLAAIVQGLSGDKDEEEEVDEVLLELQKKTSED